MKKVLQISNYLYPNIGGIEQTARDIVNSLSNGEFEQKVICFNEDAADGDYVCHRRETIRNFVDGIEVIRCGCIAKVVSQSISLAYPRQLKKVIDEFEPDVIIFHYPNPYVATFLMQYLKRDIKFVLYWHLDIVKQKILGKLFSRQTTQLLKRADFVVATSPNYIEGSPYLRKFREKCVVIPSCINEKRLEVNGEIEQITEQIKSKYNGKILCFACGRHVPYKGLTYLIQASRLLPDSFQICIGGRGKLTEQLKQEAQRDDKIHFLGRIRDEELVAYMNACNIFCFPSITKNEAFGLALAECMYLGKPAVTFTIPGSGVNYVNLNGITGIECPNCNGRAYADAILKLGKDLQLRETMGKQARLRVLDSFTYNQFQANILRLMETLLECGEPINV